MNNDFSIKSEHPNSRELLSNLFEFTPDFQKVWDSEDNYFVDNDDSYTVHGVFSEYSSYIRQNIFKIDELTLTRIFTFIEKCVTTNPLWSEGISNAACTCFLESLAGEGEISIMVKEYLGPASLEFFNEWDN